MSSNKAADIRKVLGRPSEISRAAIIDAALSIGIDNVTMSGVAKQMGVSIGALYRHVRDREELLRLVANEQLRGGAAPKDEGQHWAVLTREYAALLYKSFVRQPGLLLAYANGNFPPEWEVDSMEIYLAAMQKRGFAPAESLALIVDIRAAAIGAALHATSAACIDERIGAKGSVGAAFAARGETALPLLRSIAPDYLKTVSSPDWERVILRVLAAAAAERGEPLPAELRHRAPIKAKTQKAPQKTARRGKTHD